MTMTRLALALALTTGLTTTPTAAQSQQQAATAAASPSKLVLDNSTRILDTLDRRRAEFNADRSALRRFVMAEFDQMFDRDYAARQVLGRHARGAAAADVKNFGDALADGLMARYGDSLLNFNSQLKVQVKSETPLPRGLGVRVASEFLRSGGQPVPVDYLLRRSGNGWKVFDVMVEGVSFVQTYRQQFDAQLQRKSIAEVTRELRSGQVQVAPATGGGAP